MRKMSLQRRRVVSLAASVAALSGLGPVLFPRHSAARWVWLGLMATLLFWVILLMLRMKRDERCL
jgi:hypothetical protein